MGKKKDKEDAEIAKEFNEVLEQVKNAKTVTLNKFWIKGLKKRDAEVNRCVNLVESHVQTANLGDLANVKIAKKNMILL